MVLNCLKKRIFCIFVLTSAINLSILKQIYIYAPKRSPCALSENGIVYYARLTVSEILGFEVKEFCEISAESVSFFVF